MYIFWKMLNIRGREVVGLYIYIGNFSQCWRFLRYLYHFCKFSMCFYTCKIFNVQRSILANFQYCRFLQVSEVPTLQILNDLQFWDAYILQILNIDDLWGAYIENSQYLRSLHLQIFNVSTFYTCKFSILSVLTSLWGAYTSNSWWSSILRCLHFFKFSILKISEVPTLKNSQCLRSLYTCTSLWGAYTSNSWKFSMIEVSYISTLFKFSMLKGSTLFKFSILSVFYKVSEVHTLANSWILRCLHFAKFLNIEKFFNFFNV